MIRLITVLLTLANGLLAPPAAAVVADTKDELKARFEARDAELRQQKRLGLVGETSEGYVDVPDGAAGEKTAKLIASENADRRSLYKILADEINAEAAKNKATGRATVDTVAVHNAHRNFERAGAEEYLRVAADHWIKKKDESRYSKLLKAKSQSKVGETSKGLIEAVKPEFAAETDIAQLIKQENDARNEQYQAIARKDKSDAASVARRLADRNFRNARAGDMLKDDQGSWRKK